MRLPVRVEDPSLMRVRGALVRSAGDDGGGVRALLVGDVVDGQRILVVAVADVAAVVLLIRTAVDDALRIVNVSVLGGAAGSERLSRVVHVDEDEASSARAVSWRGTDGYCIVLFLVDHDVVGAADW